MSILLVAASNTSLTALRQFEGHAFLLSDLQIASDCPVETLGGKVKERRNCGLRQEKGMCREKDKLCVTSQQGVERREPLTRWSRFSESYQWSASGDIEPNIKHF